MSNGKYNYYLIYEINKINVTQEYSNNKNFDKTLEKIKI